MKKLALLLIPAVWFSTAAYAQPSSRSSGDPASAERLERILQELAEAEKSHPFRSRQYVVTQAELNAYLEARLREGERTEVRAISVELGDQSFTTSLLVDLDELDVSGGGTTVGLFGSLLSGTQRLEVDVDWTARNGLASYKISGARLNGVALPHNLVQWIVTTLTRRYDPEFDPQAPMELPFRIQSIRLAPGRLTMITG